MDLPPIPEEKYSSARGRSPRILFETSREKPRRKWGGHADVGDGRTG